jgi:hypothetical protein
MWIALAAAVMLAASAGTYALVRAGRRRSFGSAVALSAALIVVFEALLVHLLSPYHAVGRAGMLTGNAVIAAAGFLVFKQRRPRRLFAPPWRSVLLGLRAAWVGPAGLLVAVSAIEFVPNNWDSMTYHLARVAYWLQNGSVAAYPTNIARQITLPPGAEYLLLALQAISRSDRLANLVQFAAWLALVIAAGPLARTFGAPRRVAPWAAVLVGTLPLALLQASSTQNDVIAALMAVAVIVASLPFLHRRRHWRWPDVALLAAAGAAGLLVKPTAVVVAAPFVVWAFIAAAGSFRHRRDWAELAVGLGVGVALLAAAAGPALATSLAGPEASLTTAGFVYPGVAEPLDRIVNALRGVARQIPLPAAITDRVAPANTIGCTLSGRLCAEALFAFREDYAGNIGQALFVAAALVLGAIRWRALPLRSRLALINLPAAWFLFHALFRDNIWFTRLQLPLLGLGALGLVSFGARRGRKTVGTAGLGAAMVALVAYGVVAASRNEARPPSIFPPDIAFAGSPEAYYVYARKGVGQAHAAVLKGLAESGCRRLGMYIDGDSYDYPLAWRAMQAGVEVRHVVAADDWPCLIFSDRGAPPPPPSGPPWRPIAPFLYVAGDSR